MLLNELNQRISDVYGLPVDPALLPLRSDRTIVYREGCSIPYEFKRSEDLLDYVVDIKSNVRPVTGLYVGRMHMDTVINPNGRQIWWNGAAWVDAGGAVV